MEIYIRFVLLVMLAPLSGGKLCDIKTGSGTLKKVCCADYEEKEKDCIACLYGYTSDMGQSCRPCSKNTYGERCRYECDCLVFQICDNVVGCVEYPSITDTTLYATSGDITAIMTIRSKTDFENEKLSNEMISYYTLPVVIVVLGICVCLILYKYKILGNKKKVPSLPQNRQQIETEERLYDIIGETHMLRYVQKMLKPTNSNSDDRDDRKTVENREHSFDEGDQVTIEQCINQPLTKLSPTSVMDHVIEAIVHTKDSTS